MNILSRGDGNLEQLMSDYVAVCNRAIEENKGRFWYRQASRMSNILLGGSDFRVIVYDRNPDEPLAHYTLHFDPDPQVLSLSPGSDRSTAFTWKTSLAYVRDVAHERPDWYVTHPAMLDWNWMKDRLSDEVDRIDNRSLVAGFVLGTAATLLASAALSRARER